MSGPKVVRIVTLEEVLEICRGHLAQLDAAVEAWQRKCGRLGLTVSATELAATLQRRDAIHALLQSAAYLDLQKQAPREIAFLAEDLDTRIAAAAEKKARQRTERRRLASTAATLSAALAKNATPVPAELQAALAAARNGAGDGVEAAERALARGFALLAPAGEAPAVGARQRELAQRLGEGEATRTLADWLAGQPPADDPRGRDLDRHVAELETREGAEAARPYAERAARLAAEPSPARRQLLADSLLVELATLASARRERERNLATLTGLLAELERIPGAAAEKALIERAQAALRAQDGRVAKDLVSDVRAAIERARTVAASASRRKAVLEALSGLGYEVREGMETAWASNGNLTLHSARRAGYGVQVIGGAEGRPLQLRAVGFGRGGAERDVARDREAETLWCSDFDALKDRIVTAEASFSVEQAVPAGQAPLKIVEDAADESQRAPGRRTPLQQAKR